MRLNAEESVRYVCDCFWSPEAKYGNRAYRLPIHLAYNGRTKTLRHVDCELHYYLLEQYALLACTPASRWPSCHWFLISPRHVECAKRAPPSITPYMLRRKIHPAMSPMDTCLLIYLSFWKNAVGARISKVTLHRFHTPYAPCHDRQLHTSLTPSARIYNVSHLHVFYFSGEYECKTCSFKNHPINTSL